ncbi:MAG: hypothetical protein AB8I08_17550 [Sandaracinaceae bacterium]
MIRSCLRVFGALVLAAALVSPGAAQVPEAFDMPWSDVAPHLDDGAIRVAAVGRPDERIRRFEARRDSARRQARERALSLLHRWADDALAAVHAEPREASRVHAALAEARVERVRPRADASAVVVLRLDASALREACGRAGLPWS